MTFLITWLIAGVIGSILMGLGTSTDKEGIDSVDILFLTLLSLGGFGTLLLSTPFVAIWIRSLLK